MNKFSQIRQNIRRSLLLFGSCVVAGSLAHAQPAPVVNATNEIRIVELQGAVEVSPAGSATWAQPQNNQTLHPFDRLRTGADSRVAVRWSDQSVVPFGAATELEILPPNAAGDQCGLHLVRGVLSFFHRDQPGRIRIITRGAVAGVEGTEFVMAVDAADATTLSVIDGKVKFGSDQAALLLTNGQQAVVEPGKSPVRTAGFVANNLLQWCFYYPAVLDPADLPLTADEQKILADSLAAYRAGDLLAALAKFPAAGSGSDAVKIYHAALLLAVGEVEKCEVQLAALSAGNVSDHSQRLATALRQLIAAVKHQPCPSTINYQLSTASSLLAASYYAQSCAIREKSLTAALALAKQAAAKSPESGFAWERVAELEFCFGRMRETLTALDKSLALAPRNAQALALKGFVLAAQNKIGSRSSRGDEAQTKIGNQPEPPSASAGLRRDRHVGCYKELDSALACFNAAIALDSAFANAWLGRGLCRIRLGDDAGGREDLLIAAALKPQCAELRSYLGKAYTAAGDDAHATKELALAKKINPNDPTAWLYSALQNQQANQINDAIRDLEKSKELNNNRSVYRSQLLLDQDQAVRSANLAGMYRDAGMTEVSVREAGRAVNSDYANYSAHLFLAQSYEQLLNPNEINLRYELPAQSEYLLANLLAPTSAGLLSPTISQGDYTKLFQQNRFGAASDTEYLSRGAWTQSGAQYGTFNNFSYAVEALYHDDPGQELNSGIYQRQLAMAFKGQLTPQDSLFFNALQYEGELSSTYLNYSHDWSIYTSSYSYKEKQDPTLTLGYHHEWSPGVHTLLLLTRLDDSLWLDNYNQLGYSMDYPNDPPDDTNGVPTLAAATVTQSQAHTHQSQEIYSAELQQIWEVPNHNTILGSRFQYGHFDTTCWQHNVWPTGGWLAGQPPAQDISSLFKRISVYGYHQWQIFEPLQLIGGLTYDHLTFPANSLMVPISSTETTSEKFSPKAGFIWTPADKTSVRFAYTRSLSGAAVDQSSQIEPTQLAGFVQSYRNAIPKTIIGRNPGAEQETFNLLLEQRFDTGTYLGLSGEILNSTVHRIDGAYATWPDLLDDSFPMDLRENLDYQEKTLLFTANQLLGKEWSFGASYRLTQSILNDDFPDVPVNHITPGNTDIAPHLRTEGILQQVNLSAIYNHSSGLFAKAEALWNNQTYSGYTPAQPSDDFWQFNAFLGYRAFHRRAELTVGLLNLTDENYSLNPLTLYNNSLPRARTLMVRFRLNF